MAKKQFKTESKKLLDMMINSIYTNREIFIRELISNASDALDKRYYHDLESGTSGVTREDYTIRITPDKDARTLTISDNGIGMTKEELESNLGTIAKSGSLDFKNAHQTGEETAAENDGADAGSDDSRETREKNVTDIIGQFGVGFYSAFMVADKVTVTSRVENASNAYAWESSGTDGYTVEEAEKADAGTDVVLHLKADTDAENYSQYLEEYEIRSLIRKYSDYIHYPITMMVTKSRPAAQSEEEQAQDQKDEDQNKPPEMETYQELDTLNSMEPIWKKPKSQVTDEEYNEYYKGKFSDYENPCRVIRTSVEGVSSYTALLFIPDHTPFNYYTKDYEKGLQLYSSGVLIMDKCKDLLPDYFNFVRGLVDSQDLSLNISRETLQQDRQLKNIAKNLQKKIKADLADFMKNDREGYEKFFRNFGRSLKYGIYEGYGMTKDLLADLLLFYSSTEKKMISLDEYIAKMGEDQKYIYYAPGETVEKVDMLPQVEAAKTKGYEVLYLTDEMDEFVVKMMHDYKDKEFLSVSEADMSEEETEEEKKALAELNEKNKDLLAFIQSTLGDAVSEVKLSRRLGDASVTLTSKGGISIEMEKTLNQMPMNQDVKAEKILELNPDHAVMQKMQESFGDGTDEAGKDLTAVYARLLYDQAAMISGLSIQDPARMAQDIDTLITK